MNSGLFLFMRSRYRWHMGKIIITGGAGFIGSALLWGLNQRGISNVLLVDDPVKSPGGDHGAGHDDSDKMDNIAHLQYEELVGIKEFREKLLAGDYNSAGVEAILHMGACSSTTEKNWEYLLDNNVDYSKDIIRWCFDRGVRCVYASSGATYGSGEAGYSDDHSLFDDLKPLNLYGKSKLMVDIWARDGGYLDKIVGLRYFNVFGPNEYHKGHMRSVVAKKFEEVSEKGYIELFKSYNEDYRNGEQKRDFIYIKDAVAATLHFLDNKDLAGVYNIGTGKAETWNAVAKAMFKALGKKPNIKYIDMPDDLRDQYQYFTQADITKLRKSGFKQPFTSLEKSVRDYVVNYLKDGRHLGEG